MLRTLSLLTQRNGAAGHQRLLLLPRSLSRFPRTPSTSNQPRILAHHSLRSITTEDAIAAVGGLALAGPVLWWFHRANEARKMRNSPSQYAAKKPSEQQRLEGTSSISESNSSGEDGTVGDASLWPLIAALDSSQLMALMDKAAGRPCPDPRVETKNEEAAEVADKEDAPTAISDVAAPALLFHILQQRGQNVGLEVGNEV